MISPLDEIRITSLRSSRSVRRLALPLFRLSCLEPAKELLPPLKFLPASRSVRAPRSAALMPSSVRQCVSRPRPSPCTDDGALSSAICTQIEISAASHRKLRRRGRRAARQNKTEVVSPLRTMRELILFRGCPSVRHVGRRSVRTPFARLVLHSRDPTGAKRGA